MADPDCFASLAMTASVVVIARKRSDEAISGKARNAGSDLSGLDH